MSPQILILTNMWPTPADPAFGTFVHEQVVGLRERGCHLDVLFVNGRASRTNYLLGYPQLWRQLARHRYDLIHAHYVFSGLIARAQWHLPLVVSFHGAGEMVGYQGQLCRWLAPRVAAVTVTSPEHHQQLGYPPARIIPCGVDLARFHPGDQRAARQRLGLPLDRKLVLFCGAPRPEKRVPLIEAAVAQLQQQRPDVEFVAAIGRPHDEVPLWMQAANALALVSDYEGSPVVIKEAMAANLPIVATPVGDIPDLFAGTPGHFLVQQNIPEIAAALSRALDHGPTQGRSVIAPLSLEATVTAIAQLYDEVLSRRQVQATR
jgi:teichuronic acid biosynthesis glycosyltransferase TuaC